MWLPGSASKSIDKEADWDPTLVANKSQKEIGHILILMDRTKSLEPLKFADINKVVLTRVGDPTYD